MTSSAIPKSVKKQKGMTFIEVLVALVILVTGILGAVAMQASAKKGSFDALQRSVASSLVQDIIERMRSNQKTIAVLDTYVGTYGNNAIVAPTRCNVVGAACTPAQITANDLFEWNQSLRGADVTNDGVSNGGLVGSVGCITHAANVITVTISWQGKTATSDGGVGNAGCGTAGTSRRQIFTQAFIF